MNLPLSLTLLRIFFVPLVVVLLLTKGHNMDGWAVGVFLAAAATDLLDGHLARRRGQITKLGILLDPVADKLLTSAAFISLVQIRAAPAWMVWIIIGREFAVDGLRMIASSQGITIGASVWGKYKTVSQVVAVVLLIFGNTYLGKWDLAGDIAIWIVVIVATLSAADYFVKFSRRLGVVGGRMAPPGGGLG